MLFVARGEGNARSVRRSEALRRVGPYRFVRNPMYVGAITLLVGFGLVLDAPSVFGVAFAAFFFSNLFVIFVEEPGLARRFGETYLAYRRATNRWIPRAARACLAGGDLVHGPLLQEVRGVGGCEENARRGVPPPRSLSQLNLP